MKDFFMKYLAKSIYIYILGLLSFLNYLNVSVSTLTRLDNVESYGRTSVNDIVVIDSSDLHYITKEIDNLETLYLSSITEALKQIGTTVEESSNFNDLICSIINSQSIYGTFKDKDNNEKNLVGATVDDLPLGTAAWVNGNYIIGTGLNLEESYNQGLEVGSKNIVTGVTSVYNNSTHIWNSSSGLGCTFPAGTYYVQSTLLWLSYPERGYTLTFQCGNKTYTTNYNGIVVLDSAGPITFSCGINHDGGRAVFSLSVVKLL